MGIPEKTRLLTLAGRLEAAERGSHELDADVYEALGYEVIRMPRHSLRGCAPAWRYKGSGPFGNESRWVSQSHFTQSIDAARKLIPAPWRLETLSDHGNDRWGACLNIPMKLDCGSYARTPALALTAASLRARSGE